MKPHRLLLTPTLAAHLPLRAHGSTAARSWTANDGRVIQAGFIKLEDED